MITKGILGLGFTALAVASAGAGTMGSTLMQKLELKPLIAVQGGYASMVVSSRVQQFVGTDDNVFIYNNSGNIRDQGFVGGFAGVESSMPWISTRSSVGVQLGVEYNYFGNTKVNGVHTVGIEPATSTVYNYKYHSQTQQVLGLLKLFTTTYGRFYPYGEVGLGAAFNNNSRFNATTLETGGINIAPFYSARNRSQFSYGLGLGIDAQASTAIRIGLGYRYSNFGATTFKRGLIKFNDYVASVPFSLGSSHAYANQLLVRISYVV